MITIAVLKELGSEGFVPTIEVAYVRKCSSETNKLCKRHMMYVEGRLHQEMEN